MSLNVSSWFIDQAAQSYLAPRRRLMFGSSDYSDWVLRWPALTSRLETIDLGVATVALSNAGQRFNSLVDGGALLTTSFEIALGLTHPTSGTEWAALYTGQPSHVAFSDNGAQVQLQVQGKTRSLTDLALGSDVTSAGLDFTTSAYYPADIAWFLVTSQGGFSAVQSTSNPDLNYAEWLAWHDADSLRDVRAKGYFRGEKIYEALADLAQLSSRAVGFASGRLRFADLHGAFVADGALPMEQALDVSVTVDPAAMVNEFTAQLTRVNSASRVLYGRRTARFGARGVWYATANDARYFADDQIRFASRLTPEVSVRTALAGGLHRTPGDVVTLTHTHLGIDAREFRIVECELDLQEGTLRFDLVSAMHRVWEYQSQASSVNMAVHTITAVGSGDYLGVEESDTSGRVVRTDSLGVFQPVGVYGTAVYALDAQQVLIGGPPSSGSTQSVIRRSGDGGVTSTVVASLGPGTRAVFQFFAPHSGTCIAGVGSGAIVRSTNAGSSWNVTWTVSPGYQITRFLQPMSGTLWGATGFGNPGFTNGVYLWESVDDGVTWAPRHTVLSSGDFHTNGFYAVSGSEYLLATHGSAIEQRNTLRGTRTSPTSIGWSVVLSQVSFANIIRTDSGHLLLGFDEETTLAGGAVYRSLDAGSAWSEDGRLAKVGNIAVSSRSDGAVEAFASRVGGTRTLRFRNHTPNDLS